MNYNAYVQAICEQADVHSHILDQLSDKITPLTQIERAAAERSLQVLAEAMIGCSKHLNKKLGQPSRSDAYQSITQIANASGLSEDTLTQLNGAIGMRNAIVHDYLNLDWNRIRIVISERKYQLITITTHKICSQLNSD